MLRADSPVPLYKQLYRQLRTEIEAGTYEIGHQLPSERQLAAYNGISRLTARKAVEILREEGYVQAYQGKGCYIARAKARTESGISLRGLTERMLERGMAPTSQLLNRGVVPADRDVALRLGLQYADNVIRIRRLRVANDLPVAIHTAYLPYPLCSSLLDIDLEKQSLYRALEEISGIRLARAKQTLQTILGSDADLPLLGIQPPAPVLQLERETYDAHGRPVEYLSALYREDAVQIDIDPQVARD